MAHIYEKVVALISEEPAKRPDLEINLLLPWFQSMSGLFKTQKADVVKDILRNCEFRSVPPDVAIITQGTRGDSFYIILSGAVSIYINQTLEEQGNVSEPKVPNIPKKSPKFDCNGNHITDSDEAMEDGTQAAMLNRSSFGVHIRELGPGKSFGELALVQTNSIRNASVITEQTTDLIVIDRELYNRSLKAAQKQEVQEKLDFVNSHNLFCNWTRRQRAVLTMSLLRNYYQYGNTIIRQGSPAHTLIFIARGQMKVTINPLQLIQQYPSMCTSQEVDLHRRFRSERLRSRKSRRRRLGSDGYPRNREKHGHQISDICIVGPPDFIGEFEVLLRLPTYIQTITCIEEVETFELDLTSFTRLIAKKHPTTYGYMHHVAEMKLASRVGKFEKEQIQSPVLQNILQKFVDTNLRLHPKGKLTSGLGNEEESHSHEWYHYRDNQRRFLHNRQREKEIKEKREVNLMKTQLLLDRQIKSLTLVKKGKQDSWTNFEDSDEILPVISHDSRININPASGLVRLPRRMYSLDEPSPRSANNHQTEKPKFQRSRSFSVVLPSRPLLRKGSFLSMDDELMKGTPSQVSFNLPEINSNRPRKMSMQVDDPFHDRRLAVENAI